MTSYAYIDDILHISVEGEIEITDLFNFIDDFEQFDELPDHLKVFLDFTNATMSLKIDDISKLSKLAEQKTNGCKSVQTAFCVADPKITAYAMLYSWLPASNRVKREQFSTREAALRWLQSGN